MAGWGGGTGDFVIKRKGTNGEIYWSTCSKQISFFKYKGGGSPQPVGLPRLSLSLLSAALGILFLLCWKSCAIGHRSTCHT